jgi:hypothetical protein
MCKEGVRSSPIHRTTAGLLHQEGSVSRDNDKVICLLINIKTGTTLARNVFPIHRRRLEYVFLQNIEAAGIPHEGSVYTFIETTRLLCTPILR